MTGKLRIRLFAAFIACTCAFSARAAATPIKLKLEDLIKQVERPRMMFAPARAGWNGPERSKPARTFNLLFEQYGPEGSERAMKASLIDAAKPDVRAFIGIGMVILLLRVLRNRDQLRLRNHATSNAAFGNQPHTAADALKAA